MHCNLTWNRSGTLILILFLLSLHLRKNLILTFSSRTEDFSLFPCDVSQTSHCLPSTCITENVVWCSAPSTTRSLFLLPWVLCLSVPQRDIKLHGVDSILMFYSAMNHLMTVCKYIKLSFCVMLCKACPKLIYLHVEYVLSLVLRLWDHPRCFWRCHLTSHFPSLRRIYFALFYLVFQLAAAEFLMFNDEGISLPNILFEKGENT